MKRVRAGVLGLAVWLFAGATQAVIENAPVFAGYWTADDAAGSSSLFYDMSFEGLAKRWRDTGEGEYLADVEAYRRDGEWRFAAAWRRGAGNGALLLAPWNDFVKVWNEVKDSQELIELEVIQDGATLKFLGVWRRRQPGGPGSGALFVGLDWPALVAQREALGHSQYLAKVETYQVDGKRLFAGVWRHGPGNGALYWFDDWSKFRLQKQQLDAHQTLQDFEMFQDGNGTWNFIGVWRAAGRGGPLDASRGSTAFEPLTPEQFAAQWDQRRTKMTLVGLSAANPVTLLRGDVGCRYGDPDCNRCATDVAQQFRLAFEGGHRPWIGWHGGSWSFRGDERYPPDQARPEVAFRPYGEGADAGIVNKHVQGFVRTNSSQFPYAGSHSHKDVGSLFFVENRRGGLALHAIYKSSRDHPSGVAVLGDHLFVAEKGQLRWFKVSEAGQPQQHRYAVDEMGSAGGGLGLARLHDGSTLLIVSAPGDGFRKGSTEDQREDNLRPRTTRFYRLANPLAPPAGAIKPFAEWQHDHITARPDTPMAYSENLSVVTECGTGRLYTIHTTGDWALKGDGYWRLSRVEDGPHGVRLHHVDMARQDQHNEHCHHRSAATVHVDQEGQLEFLCSERAVIKWNPSGRFDFREGRR